MIHNREVVVVVIEPLDLIWASAGSNSREIEAYFMLSIFDISSDIHPTTVIC